jgi:hypothetical protein
LKTNNNNNNSSPFDVTSGSAKAKPKAMILLLFGLVTMSIVLAKLEIWSIIHISDGGTCLFYILFKHPIVGFIQPLG